MANYKILLACLILLTISSQICVAHDLHNIRDSLGKLLKAVTSCDQNLDCATSGVAGSFVPDPADCHNYYICVLSDQEVVASDSTVACPSGQYFNADTSACEDEVEPCNSTCDGRCSYICSAELDVVPYPGNCSMYEICLIGGGTQLEPCPSERPYFNGVDCTEDPLSCCDSCSLNCVVIGVEIPDPCDCQMYYVCSDLGVPPESQHLSCLDGDHFDPNLGGCATGSFCEPLCTSDFCDTFTSASTPTANNTEPPTGPTTTLEVTTSAPPASTTISLCIDTMICTETGKFAKCPFCFDDYFLCTSVSEPAISATCPNGEAFNPVPEYPFCLAIADCPYPS